MNNRYKIGEIQNNKYPIWDSKNGSIIAESLNKDDAEIITTALNCYDFMIPILSLKK